MPPPPPCIAQWQRVRVRDAHCLRGRVVALEDEGNIAIVRFDRHDDAYPYHVKELEPEDNPCGCIFCRRLEGLELACHRRRMAERSTPEWRDGWVEGFEAMRRRCIAFLMANNRLDLAPHILGIEAKPPDEKTAPEKF